jgi:YfiH family protein
VNPAWLIPDWPTPLQVRSVCTTRAGGCSLAPYDSLNLGAHVGDRLPDVAANRVILQQSIAAQPVFLSQLHGVQVLALTNETQHGIQADACITSQPGVACTVMVADCLPVLLTNRQGSLVAAAHAGWRGLAGQGGRGILETVVESFYSFGQVDRVAAAPELLVWLGPCIGPQAFEVGDEVRHVFVANDPATAKLFVPAASGKWLANLPALARLRLQTMGVAQIFGNDGSPAWCTVGQPSQFFSHRRDRVSGRMAACIWLA